MTFRLPDRVIASSNFTQFDGKTVLATIDGSRLLEALDSFFADDDWFREVVRTGVDPLTEYIQRTANQGKFLGRIFTEPVPPEAIIASSTKPSFDYKREVAEARAGMVALLAELGISKPHRPDAISDGAEDENLNFTNLEVVGVQVIHDVGEKRIVRQFGEITGYTLSVSGTLPKKFVGSAKGSVTTAIADNGDSLLSRRQPNLRVAGSSKLGDQWLVNFEVKLTPPSAEVKGIDLIQGSLIFDRNNAIRTFRFGTLAEVIAAPGNDFEATIEPVQMLPASNDFNYLFKLEMSKHQFKKVGFLESDGNELNTEEVWSWVGQDRQQIIFRFESKPPGDTRIVVETFDNDAKVEIPFELRNLDLIGLSRE